MGLSLKESRAVTEMAKVLYHFLPGSGARNWRGHVSFQTIAKEVGVGEFWQPGSKEPAIASLLERTLEHHRELFENLILSIVRAGLKYRQKNNDAITSEEIKTLNGLIAEVGFKFPDLWDPEFLQSLGAPGHARAARIVEQELATERLNATAQPEAQKKLQELKTELYDLYGQSDRQAAGFALEQILNELFTLFDLAPRKPFRVVGEQIDGSFELDGEIYLLEAKWEAQPLPEAPLLVFRGKVEGKSQFTRGLFIALEGFSPAAIDAITRGKQANFFLMHGNDLAAVLEGHIALDDLLRAKLRRLAEEGRLLTPAKEFIGGSSVGDRPKQ